MAELIEREDAAEKPTVYRYMYVKIDQNYLPTAAVW